MQDELELETTSMEEIVRPKALSERPTDLIMRIVKLAPAFRLLGTAQHNVEVV